MRQNIKDELSTTLITNDKIIQDILCDITYASAYWVISIQPSIEYKELIGNSIEEKWYDCISKSGYLIIKENDEDTYSIHKLYYSDLDKAVSKIRKLPQFLIKTSWDGIFADAILQYAIFNDIIYG